ncbi:MAG: hypothetical protein OEV30_10415 [Ignavibacteria bacterium]|nr:hypothetical protein [Ignavibacteria bacterium]
MTGTQNIRFLIAAVAFALLALPGSEAHARFQNSLTLSLGMYSSSGFGTNPYVAGRYNYFLPGDRFFVEASLGFTSLKSDVLGTLARSQVFETQDLYTYEFAVAYDPSPSGYIPFVLAGVAGINQGGQNTFSGVIGLGKRIPLGYLFGSNKIGLRYDIRDQIFSQTINNAEPFISHNIQFSLGLQLYF